MAKAPRKPKIEPLKTAAKEYAPRDFIKLRLLKEEFRIRLPKPPNLIPVPEDNYTNSKVIEAIKAANAAIAEEIAEYEKEKNSLLQRKKNAEYAWWASYGIVRSDGNDYVISEITNQASEMIEYGFYPPMDTYQHGELSYDYDTKNEQILFLTIEWILENLLEPFKNIIEN